MAKIRMSPPSPFKISPISHEIAEIAQKAAANIPLTGEKTLHENIANEQKKLVPEQAFEVSYQIGQVYEVPLAKIASNPLNPRYVYSELAIDNMVSSLLENGQRIAAIGFSDGVGGVILIEGETRLRAARAARFETLRIEIRNKPLNEQKLYEEARAANVERREQTPLDDAMRWNELLTKGIYANQRALANALNINEDVVSRTRSIANMSSQLCRTLADYPNLLNLKMLYQIKLYLDETNLDDAKELIYKIDKSGLSARDVESLRKSLAKEPVKRTRAIRESISYHGLKGEIKAFEDEGRVELSLKGLTLEQTKEFTITLKNFIGQPDS